MFREILKAEKIKRIIKIIGNILTIIAIILVIKRLIQYDVDYSMLFSGKNLLIMIGLTIALSLSILSTPLSWTSIIHFLCNNKVRFRDAQRVFCKANLMKYIPGNVLQYVGRNEIAIQYNLNHARVALSTLLDVVANVTGIFLLAMVCYSDGISLFIKYNHLPVGLIWTIGVIALIVTVVLLVIFRKKIIVAIRQIQWKKYLCCILIHSCFGLWFGCIFVVVIKYIIGIQFPSSQFFTIIGAFLLSWLIGFLIPGAPAGIGFREAAATLFLAGIIPEDQILFGIVIYRIINTLGDVLAFGMSRIQINQLHDKMIKYRG